MFRANGIVEREHTKHFKSLITFGDVHHFLYLTLDLTMSLREIESVNEYMAPYIEYYFVFLFFLSSCSFEIRAPF